MKKAVFLDVDGTLLPEGNGKSVLESTKEAIKLLQAQDIGAVLCTGRHPTELVTLGLLDVPYDGFVLLNGQLVLDRNMKKLYSHPITGIEYGTMNIPYAEFYKAEIDDAYTVDAVSSATTKGKWGMNGEGEIVEGTYNNGNGTILGVKFPVEVSSSDVSNRLLVYGTG